MRSESDFLRSIASVNFKGAGPKALRLFEVEQGFFGRLRAELERLTEAYAPSHVETYGHATNWTNPFGAAVPGQLHSNEYSPLARKAPLDLTFAGAR